MPAMRPNVAGVIVPGRPDGCAAGSYSEHLRPDTPAFPARGNLDVVIDRGSVRCNRDFRHQVFFVDELD
jgi:hypothetical protein